jgi:hypothetical protein
LVDLCLSQSPLPLGGEEHERSLPATQDPRSIDS